MRFPTGKKVEELSFFTGMQMRIVPEVSFKVEKWTPSLGAKSEMQSAWFRIKGIPVRKRSERNICYVASFVGLPLQVDMVNAKKFDYVRVKIGAKDITKVPAIVEGMIDFFFYDFEFQREVPQEGVTNVAGNKWMRVDKPGGGNPSPKKPRMGGVQDMPPGKDQSESGPSRLHKGKGQCEDLHQLGEDLAGNKDRASVPGISCVNADISDGESEDRGLQFGDILSPGCESLQFGSFQVNETKKIWSIQIDDTISAAINEYGTNLFKSKFDPLAAIEAKQALLSGVSDPFLLDTIHEKVDSETENQLESERQVAHTGMVEEVQVNVQSPMGDSQEPPRVEWSSQEDNVVLNKSDLVENEGVYIGSERVNEVDIGRVVMAGEEEGTGQVDKLQTESEDNIKTQETRRQSERVKRQGLEHIKVADKAEALAMKNLEGLQQGDDKEIMEKGVEMLKTAALQFHARGVGQEDTGVVLLQ